MKRWAALLLLVACSRTEKPGVDASVPVNAAPPPVDGHALVVNGCLSCHSEPMLAQQRLTPAQWSKVVTKMVGWGANVEPPEVAPLVAYLAAAYGPDAGAFVVERLPAADAPRELASTDDAPFPAGDGERGRALFVDRCAACHGSDARGNVGVNLVDRPGLYRAADFARTVRGGRGKMLPLALTDAEVGDVLAHLRALRNPRP